MLDDVAFCLTIVVSTGYRTLSSWRVRGATRSVGVACMCVIMQLLVYHASMNTDHGYVLIFSVAELCHKFTSQLTERKQASFFPSECIECDD